MKNNKKEIFAKRLKVARKMSGYSQDKLVVALDRAISKNAISKYEKGQMLPSSKVLILLSRALDISVDYFFRPIKYENQELKQFEYRKAVSKFKKSDEVRIENCLLDYFERYSELEELINERLEFKNPLGSENLVKNKKDIEKKAEKVREKWKLGNDPIATLIDILEEEGIKIIELDEKKSFNGISGKIGNSLVIAINKNIPSDRKRFTILHELAHLIMRFDNSLTQKEVEILCHKFAGAFLMPKEIFIREFGKQRSNMSTKELIDFKEYFGASIQAIVYRAFDLGLITERFKNKFYRKWSALGYRKNEPGEYQIKEKPTRFKHLLIRATVEDYISFSKATHLASKNITDFEKEIELVV